MHHSFSVAMLQAIEEADCQVKACSKRTCSKAFDGTYYGCDCDVVVGLEDGKTFIGTVAYTDDRQRYPVDVQLLGLYQELDAINDETKVSVFGIELNNPMYPKLVPKFQTLQQFANLIVQSIGETFGLEIEVTELNIGVIYVPELDPDALFNLFIDFTVVLQHQVNLDSSIGIGGMVKKYQSSFSPCCRFTTYTVVPLCRSRWI
jgi:hypothetical protein